MIEQNYMKRFLPTLGDWTLGNLLGSGSFGNVWEASRMEDGVKKTIAIKEVVVPPASAGTIEAACLQGIDLENAKLYFRGTLDRAVAEAKMQQVLLECENIVSIHDYQIRELTEEDEFGWAFYIFMDRVESFPDYLMKHGIPIRKVIQLGIHLCHALEHCQKAGIIHRDVKPENIFYHPEKDCFQLGDFGIAHYMVRPTESKGRPGTLTHMSPEVYQGADFRYEDDVYAVGMILYKLLNFNRIPLLPDYPGYYMPDQRDNALVKRLKGSALPLPALCRVEPEQAEAAAKVRAGVRFEKEDLEIIRQLSEIAHKAIHAKKTKRYEDAAQLRAALEQIR